MAKSRSSLEFTILSAEDLRIDGKPVKKNAFALVRTDHSNSKSTSAGDGSYPRWNEKVVLDFPRGTQFVTVEVQCRVGSAGNRVIGTVNVPVTDFLGHFKAPENYLNFLSYRLRDPRGGKNGIINFSVRVNGGGGGGDRSGAARKKESAGFGGNYEPSLSSTYLVPASWRTPSYPWAVPVAREGNGYGGGGGVVTGVPVWGANSRFI
ncbi:BON1-associated protein 2 [Linum grandiflorum]